MKPYTIGEIVLLNWHGWLKAFRVIGVKEVAENQVEYQMAMVEMEKGPQYEWIKPDTA